MKNLKEETTALEEVLKEIDIFPVVLNHIVVGSLNLQEFYL